MRKDDIITELFDIIEGLKEGVRGNPAILQDGELKFFGTLSDKEKVVELIGEWNYKMEKLRMEKLKNKKIELEKELKELFL